MRLFVIFLLVALSFPALAQTDLRGKDLEGQDLAGRDLRGADLRGANLTDANLTGADLTGSKVEDTDFRGADLSKAKMRGLDFTKALTRDTILRAADLRQIRGLTDITDLDFTDADLRGADLTASTDFKPGSARFYGSRYDSATRWPKGIDPKAIGARLEAALPQEKEVAKTPAPKKQPPVKREVGKGRDLRKKDLSSRDLRPEELEGANLEGATLWSVDLRGMNLKYTSFKGADLTMANLEGADLTGADMREATFIKASLRGAKLVEANLQGVDLTTVKDIRDASFRGADLRGLKGLPTSNLGGNDWRDADLRGAYLAGPWLGAFKDARFRRARYDRTTVWPNGFDQEDAGAELVETETPADVAPPRLFAPDHDWNAPSEETVKKVFVQLLLAAKYSVNRSKQGDKPIEEPKGNRTTFHFTGMKYGRESKGCVIPENLSDRELAALDAKTLPTRTLFLILVNGEMTSLDASGSHQKEKVEVEVGFWKKENGAWEASSKKNVLILK